MENHKNVLHVDLKCFPASFFFFFAPLSLPQSSTSRSHLCALFSAPSNAPTEAGTCIAHHGIPETSTVPVAAAAFQIFVKGMKTSSQIPHFYLDVNDG